MGTHSTVARRNSEPLLVLLESHPIVGEYRSRSKIDEVDRTICIEHRREKGKNNKGNCIPAGLSIYPQKNGTCCEAWVPRVSKFTAISIVSPGWFCMSPENRRHSPSVTCCEVGVVIVSNRFPGCLKVTRVEVGGDSFGR
jgi:hypothetical protein